MAQYKPLTYRAKSGAEVTIRSAIKADAASLLALARAVIAEEIYQLTSLSEFNSTVADEEKWIDSHGKNPNHIILVAEMDSVVVGMLDFSNGHRERIAHTGQFGISVAKSARDQGIGRILLTALVDWATENDTIEKIGLFVHSGNQRAISLYKKMGFVVEGIRTRDIKYGADHYVDTIVMGRFIGSQKRNAD